MYRERLSAAQTRLGNEGQGGRLDRGVAVFFPRLCFVVVVVVPNKPRPLQPLTVQVLEALGHHGVDLSAAAPQPAEGTGAGATASRAGAAGSGAEAMDEDGGHSASEGGSDDSAVNDMEEGSGDSEYAYSGGGDDDDDAEAGSGSDGDGDGGEDSEEERDMIILCSTNLGRWERYEAQHDQVQTTLSSTQGERRHGGSAVGRGGRGGGCEGVL